MLITRFFGLAVLVQVLLVFPMVGECASLGSRDQPGQQHEGRASAKNGGAGNIPGELGQGSALTRHHERRKSHLRHRASGERKTDRDHGAPSPPALGSLTVPSSQGVQRLSIYMSHCTSTVVGGVVRLHGNRVDAKANMEDPSAALMVISVRVGLVRIQAANSNRSLCFNKTGVLQVKKNGRGPLCEFHQTVSPTGYIQFYSAYKPHRPQKSARHPNPVEVHFEEQAPHDAWFVAFDERGNPLPGTSRYGNHRCYELLNLSPTLATEIDLPPGMNRDSVRESVKNRLTLTPADASPVVPDDGVRTVNEPVLGKEKKKTGPHAKRTRNPVPDARTKGHKKHKLDVSASEAPVVSSKVQRVATPAPKLTQNKPVRDSPSVSVGSAVPHKKADKIRHQRKKQRRIKASDRLTQAQDQTPAALFATVAEPLSMNFPAERRPSEDQRTWQTDSSAWAVPSSADSPSAEPDPQETGSPPARTAFILLEEGGWREVPKPTA